MHPPPLVLMVRDRGGEDSIRWGRECRRIHSKFLEQGVWTVEVDRQPLLTVDRFWMSRERHQGWNVSGKVAGDGAGTQLGPGRDPVKTRLDACGIRLLGPPSHLGGFTLYFPW